MLPVFGITIAITVFLTNKIFSLKEIKGQKKNMMFRWVHDTLVGDVYIPLSSWANSVCLVLNWRSSPNLSVEYKTHILLYRISKLLNYAFKNRSIVGAHKFFTNCEKSNRFLSCMLVLAIEEIRNNLESPLPKKKNTDHIAEDRIIAIEFLSRLGECDNYTDFLLHLYEKDLKSEELETKIIILRNMLSEENGIPLIQNHASFCNDCLLNIFEEDDVGCTWQRSKLYAYCYLFSCLMNYELYNMYDSWYVEHRRKHKIIHKNAKKVQKLLHDAENCYNQYREYQNKLLESSADFKDLESIVNSETMTLTVLKDILAQSKIHIPNLDDQLIEFLIYKKKVSENSKFIYKATESVQENTLFLQIFIFKLKRELITVKLRIDYILKNQEY
jgi:hypothetical protein